MNFLADESVDGQIVHRLRAEGHDVQYVAEMEPGISDDVVLSRANDRQAVLITQDKDFGELVFRLGQVNNGVVLLRLSGLLSESKAELVAASVAVHSASFVEAFSVISPGRLRIRHRE